jgi:hypothetical protein
LAFLNRQVGASLECVKGKEFLTLEANGTKVTSEVRIHDGMVAVLTYEWFEFPMPKRSKGKEAAARIWHEVFYSTEYKKKREEEERKQRALREKRAEDERAREEKKRVDRSTRQKEFEDLVRSLGLDGDVRFNSDHYGFSSLYFRRNFTLEEAKALLTAGIQAKVLKPYFPKVRS